jgi:DNA-binding transcriptional LysR family regulator
LRNGSTVRVDGPFASNEPTGLQSAAIAGRGIALIPLFFAVAALEAGQLVTVLPKQVGGQVQIAVVYPERELVPPIVRAFVDELVAWGRKEFVALAEIEGKCTQHAAAQKRGAGRRKPTTKRS